MSKSIATCHGDDGTTSLFYGGRVFKDDIRMEIIGKLDEVTSHLGVAYSIMKGGTERDLIDVIQNMMVMINAEIATEEDFVDDLVEFYRKCTFRRLDANGVEGLTEVLHSYEREVHLENKFVLPGSNLISAHLDLARTVLRGAERKLVTLTRGKVELNPHILPYINRLSDVLFILARVMDTNKEVRHFE